MDIEYRDSLEDWECRIDSLKGRVEEERNLARTRETTGRTTDQPSTQGQVQDKTPPPTPSCGTRCEPDVWDWVPWEEEMVSEVHTPKLEEAINFDQSKRATKRSNRDLSTRRVRQIHSQPCHARDRSKSSTRQRPRQSDARCYFCKNNRCDFKIPEKCPAMGKKCNKCNKRDHFANTTACKRGYEKRRIRHNRATKPATRRGRAVQVRGLHGSKRAPKALVNILRMERT